MQVEEAKKVLNKYINSIQLKQHMIYSAYIIKELAEELNENPEKWFIAGLLHDIDIEQENYSEDKHGLLGVDILKNEGLDDEEVLECIKYHSAELNGLGKREKKFHFALSASESVSGLISAMALILPDKKVEKVKVKSLLKRMKEKAFARNVSRENIMECEHFGMSLDKFMEIALRGAKKAEAETEA